MFYTMMELSHDMLTGYLDCLKDVLKSSGDDSPLGWRIYNTLHSERFATACLSISKNCPIVALSYTLFAKNIYNIWLCNSKTKTAKQIDRDIYT